MSSKDAHVAVTPSTLSPTKNDGRYDSPTPYDPATERRVLRKLDFQVLPVLFILFLISFVDRGNLGNAHIQGMDAELHLKGNNYNTAVYVFTLAYVIFGIPANIIFKAVGPKSLSLMMFFWGFAALGQGLVHNAKGLIALRFVMGIFEAGFVPGCAYLIGSYYTKDEFLRRYTIFFSAAILAGAFNGLLATLFTKMAGLGGQSGWRWIFIMEGSITVLFSFLSYFTMIDFPHKPSRLFGREEKEVILARNQRDGGEVAHDKLGRQTLRALLDWKIWLATIIYIGVEENASSVVAFQPSVLKGLGYTATGAQVHSIPIYMVAFVLSLSCAYAAEQLRQRALFAMLGCCLNVVGLVIELKQPKAANVKYVGMFFLTSGSYIVMPITVVWLAINVAKGYRRAVAFGAVIAVGNCGAFVSSNVFLTRQQPTYRLGFSVGLGMNVMAMVGIIVMYTGLRLANSRKDKKAQRMGHDLDGHYGLDGEKDPHFRYNL